MSVRTLFAGAPAFAAATLLGLGTITSAAPTVVASAAVTSDSSLSLIHI